MAVAYIGIGSNIDPERNVPAALHLLSARVRITTLSTFYRTKALDMPGSEDFINGVARIETNQEPYELKHDVLRKIEQTLGRQRSENKYASRTIDLDILLYNNRVINDIDIVVPDPDITEREFIYVPLIELDPDIALPDKGMKLADLVDINSCGAMTPLNDFTIRLRKEIGIEPAKS